MLRYIEFSVLVCISEHQSHFILTQIIGHNVCPCPGEEEKEDTLGRKCLAPSIFNSGCDEDTVGSIDTAQCCLYFHIDVWPSSQHTVLCTATLLSCACVFLSKLQMTKKTTWSQVPLMLLPEVANYSDWLHVLSHQMLFAVRVACYSISESSFGYSVH